jgi:hypothetical protein
VDAYAAVLRGQEMCGPHPPKANDVSAATPVNTAVDITLNAKDDGLPGPMSYIIVTLPAHGRLSDPNGGQIGSVPYTLLGNGKVVIFTPKALYLGADSFTYKANDGGQPPDGGDSNIANVTLSIGGASKIYGWNMDTNPGWTTTGQWAWGHPTGGNGDHGNPDPTNGYTGTNVYGYNLTGGYANNITQELPLTTTAIDCSQLTQVHLKFMRWLGVEKNAYDHAYVRVSKDGSNWTTIWQNDTTDISDTAWVAQDFDISAIANNQATVYVRWVMGTTDTSYTFCGWNIDDVEIWGLKPTPPGLGDMNCDGVVDAADIDPFFIGLGDPNAYHQQFPNCNIMNGDVNQDGAFDAGDIDLFMLLLG